MEGVAPQAAVTLSPRITLETNNALLTVYDPKLMKDWVKKSRAWVYDVKDNDYGKLDPVRAGLIAVWPLGGKGGRYTARVCAGELPADWKPYEKGQVAGLGVVVESAHLFVGPGERIPGDGYGDRLLDLEDEGKLIAWPDGRYTTVVHVLNWKVEGKFFTEDGDPNEQAPPDFAIVLAPLPSGDFAPPRPIPPLLDFLPKPKVAPPTPGSLVPRPRPIAPRPEVARAPARRSRSEEKEWKPAPDPLPPPKPGEIRVGMRVRHAQYGEGTVLFIREGFPKVKVDFRGREEKVDRSELTVVAY
jgi:hypothetical protein